MRKLVCYLCLLPVLMRAQPYLGKEGKTRHRFAQSVFGCDLQSSFGGSSAILSEGKIKPFRFAPQFNPRIYIAGTHFWGHAEFYVSFQLPALKRNSYEGTYYSISRSDIFGVKIYPWSIQKKKLRPFIGFALSGTGYVQYTAQEECPLKIKLKAPLLAGLNYCSGKYLFDLSLCYNYDNKQGYYITPTQRTTMKTPPFLLSAGLRRWLETTAGSEKNYQDGSAQKHYENLKRQKKLSSFFIGAGPSSAFYAKTPEFNRQLFPFMGKPYATVFAEFSAGYFYELLRLHVAAAFRHNRALTEAFGITQRYRRTSLSIESFVYLLDYHGFDPYIGLCASAERLGFSHASDTFTTSASALKPAAGIIFGWDILPDKLQGFVLRTNLRYFPDLTLNAAGKTVFMDQLEFNFIQLVVYPQRVLNFRKELSRQD